jgi:thermitase
MRADRPAEPVRGDPARVPTNFVRSFAAAVTLALAWGAQAQAASVIVKYRAGRASTRRTALLRALGVGRTIGTVRGQGARVMRVGGNPVAIARRLAKDPDVLYAEPNATMRATVAPDDPLFGQLGGLTAINASAAWDTVGLGSFPPAGGVPVGIVDTGIDADHEDLRGKVSACASSLNGTIARGVCADDNDHGTHVAGTIAAIANNAVGVAGVAFNSPLIVCRALGGAAGSGTIADVASCVRWVHERGAKVISMSLGGGASITLRNAVRAAWAGGGRRGSLLVAAAGNDGSAAVEYPAGYPEVVSVAAVEDGGRHAGFSNSNADVEVAAPGVNVLSTRRGGGYVRFSGTSMATPHAAGVAALVWDAHRRSEAGTIRARLDAGVRDLGSSGRDPEFGFGLIDAQKAASG